MNKEFIAIEADGTISTCLIKMTKKRTDLESYIAEQAKKVQMVQQIDNGFYVAVQNGHQSVARQINTLSFTTYFTVSHDDNTAVLALRNGDINIKHTLVAKVPDDCLMVFMRIPDGEIYIFALSKKDGSIYRLPLPNVYSEGRVCMGGQYSPNPHGMSATEAFTMAETVFNEAVWNRDLTEHSTEEDRRALWRWNLDSEEPEHIPFPEDWEKHCQTLSNDEFNSVAKHILKCNGYVPPKAPEAPEVDSRVAEDGTVEW